METSGGEERRPISCREGPGMTSIHDPNTTPDARIDRTSVGGPAAQRPLLWLAGSAAVLGFAATSLTWRLGDKAAVIDSGLRALTTLVERSTTDSQTAFRRVDGQLAAQAGAMADLAAALTTIKAAGRDTQTALAALERVATRDAEAVGQHGRHLSELTLEFARFRRDTEDRLAAHQDATRVGRDEMLAAVTKAIAGVEDVMRQQAEELRTQQQAMNAAAVQMRSRQQRLLGEATEAIAVQLDGLRQIVTRLQEETDADTPAGAGVPPTVAVGLPLVEKAIDTETPVSGAPEQAAARDEESAVEPKAEAAAETPPAAVEAAVEVATQPADTVTE
jgi:hypothetical protein